MVYLRSCPINRLFLLRAIEAPFTQNPIRDLARGMALQHLSITDPFGLMAVPLPPEAEQASLVTRLEKQLESIGILRAVTEDGLQKLPSLDQSILAKAFRGELVPQDPNDEPASVLLDRIRAEREAQSAKPRIKKKTPGSTKRTKKAPPVSVNENDDLPLFNSLQK